MNEVFVEIVLRAAPDPALRELISFQLHEWGFSGFLEEDLGIRCYLKKEQWNDELQHLLSAFLEAQGPAVVSISGVTEILNENWNLKWEATIQPIEVGTTFIVAPSWHPVAAVAGKIVLTIDPKMSFGTGYHESTRLMLTMVEHHGRASHKVLDVGTGTGVLAIAAAKLGARSVIGIDVDEWSYENARENVSANGCAASVEIRLGSLDVVAEAGFDLILANITRNVILTLIPVMFAKLRSGGLLLCSGLMREDRTLVEEALRRQGGTMLAGAEENEWIGIAARKG